MNKYKVKYGQNLFDIALCLYGDIEGVFDLLISNPWLSMTTDLKPDTELFYHSDFILNKFIHDEINNRSILPVNGERHVYYKHTDEPLMGIYKIIPEATDVYFVVRGNGQMIVDWGDDSQMETIILSASNSRYSHFFDNVADERKIKIYGNFSLTYWNVSGMRGDILPIRPLYVERYVNNSNVCNLKGLFLFDDTYEVNLSDCIITDLLPIGNMSLELLDLRKASYTDPMAQAKYFNYVVDHYGSRRGCDVYMDIDESLSEGEKAAIMAPIDKILSNPDWNIEGDEWRFFINGSKYTYGFPYILPIILK